MQKILITGGAGFVGHHIIQTFLRDTEYKIVVLDRLDTSGNLNRLREVLDEDPSWESRLEFIWHDLKASINEIVAKQIGNVEYIFHLAAGSHVERSIDYPMEFVMDNVVGTTNLLDYARTYASDTLKMFLYFSTDEVFGSAPIGTNYKEWDRYNSGNPYSASKAGAEEMCLAYFNTYKVPVVITHTMNVFGIRQHPEKYIPLVIKKVRDGESVTIHSNAEKTKAGSRFYINTEDVASAMKFMISNYTTGEKYNIVGEKEVDNLQLARIIADIIGKELKYEMLDFHSSRPGHDMRYSLCGEKMKSMGWTPQKKLEERLEEVISWTLGNADRWLI
ncbi:MAG TPA: NAD-dependent epimerase/dehydratase family protein [Flavobacteriales bacterium]|nr:NAD-dependent epimerase/dehydratase family protein [Flavobacteriales bacterium]